MGFSYRKSFKAGPIRITASKSGISYSAGVKGARVTKRADGRVQTTLSAPGTGMRYTATSGGKRSSRPAAKPTAPSEAALKAAYQQIYTAAVQALRDGTATGAELRGQLHNEGLAMPRLLRAVTDAEKYLAGEAKRQAKQQERQQAANERQAHAEEAKRQAAADRAKAREAKERAKAERTAAQEPFVQHAAQMFRDGVKYNDVMRWLKQNQGGGFFERSDLISRAQKIAKGKA